MAKLKSGQTQLKEIGNEKRNSSGLQESPGNVRVRE
jgi:hypothetical protein